MMSNIFKTTLLLTVMTLLLMLAGRAFGGQRGMLMALAFAAVLNFVSYFFSDKIALATYRAQSVGRDDLPRVYNIVERLAQKESLPMPKVYLIPSDSPNAFATGRNPNHASVAVTQGILGLLTDDELEGVLAHELSHIGNRDTRLNAIAASVALFLRLPYLLFKRKLTGRWVSGGRYNFRDEVVFSEGSAAIKAGFDVLALPVAVYILVVAPVLGTLLRAAISREREFLADADAALLTRFPQGLLGALAKIGGAGSALPNSNPAFSHFYFANPAAAESWFSGGPLATHPPPKERILRLVTLTGSTAVPELEAAVAQGKRYAQERAALPPLDELPAPAAADELDPFTRGNPMGRDFRVAASEPVPVYDNIRPGNPPWAITHVLPGALIVAFDDPGPKREVITASQTFGFIENSVELVPLENVIPAEIYDSHLRAAIEAKLPPLGAVAVRAKRGAARSGSIGFDAKAIAVAAVLVAVLAATLLVLLKLAR